ncbi:hypothetical protein D9O50_07155 [Oxalobacteraceae bacterium CAVE-383]|nr:hypothetical protein D9O50_07155 [Oxalobacteraceae bacterium CAVE-383]
MYKYQATRDDPLISMDSDYELQTYFLVNTKNPAANRCEDFDRAGYIQKVDSIFISSKPNREITIRSAANKSIVISAEHRFNHPEMSGGCGPLLRMFTPLAGGKYIAKMNDMGRICTFTIDRIDEKTQAREPVAFTTLSKCSK